MFKSLSKRTKVSLGILGGLVIIAAGVFIYGVSTGKLQIFAHQYWFPGGGGTISGKVTCVEPCQVGGSFVRLKLRQTVNNVDSEKWSKKVDVSPDGSYSFHRVPYTNENQYYEIETTRVCPPTTGALGWCEDYFSERFRLTESAPNKVADLKLRPRQGRLVIAVRTIVVNEPGPGYGERQKNYAGYCQGTGETGVWDCPVPYANIKWSQMPILDGKSKADENGVVILRLWDYRFEGSVDIKAEKDGKSGSGSTNVIGCQNNTKKIYIR